MKTNRCDDQDSYLNAIKGLPIHVILTMLPYKIPIKFIPLQGFK